MSSRFHVVYLVPVLVVSKPFVFYMFLFVACLLCGVLGFAVVLRSHSLHVYVYFIGILYFCRFFFGFCWLELLVLRLAPLSGLLRASFGAVSNVEYFYHLVFCASVRGGLGFALWVIRCVTPCISIFGGRFASLCFTLSMSMVF